MFGTPVIVRRRSKDEAEKPFWISYADLMTALMVLFLVVMSVALLAVTKKVNKIEQEKARRQEDIAKLLDEVQRVADPYGVKVDRDQYIIDFGDKARFDKGSYTLIPQQERLLRAFVPDVLAIARNDLGLKWLKQIVVEGFASPEGEYLFNLNLSLERSQRVLCTLFALPYPDEHPMTPVELEQVRDLFLVGGYSFNATKYNAATKSYDESRRVELRLEFLSIDEARPSTPAIAPGSNFGKCALSATAKTAPPLPTPRPETPLRLLSGQRE
jgi:outer membrane protein OmpA-like peptidoglycan-associated protein